MKLVLLPLVVLTACAMPPQQSSGPAPQQMSTALAPQQVSTATAPQQISTAPALSLAPDETAPCMTNKELPQENMEIAKLTPEQRSIYLNRRPAGIRRCGY